MTGRLKPLPNTATCGFRCRPYFMGHEPNQGSKACQVKIPLKLQQKQIFLK